MQAVLLVEDDDAMEAVLRSRFTEAGIDLDRAHDGYAAISCIRSRSYDAIILDLVLRQGLGGFGVLNYLEMERPELLPRVFLSTGMSEQTIINAAPQLLPRFFRKPYDERKLVRAVLDLMQEHPATSDPQSLVLVVDDDAATATTLGDVIAAAGWNARVAHDGRTALEIIESGVVGVLVLDLLMEDISGSTVIEYLRGSNPALLARTIVISGVPLLYRDRLGASDVAAALEKPIRPPQLLDAIARVWRNRPKKTDR